jgi:RNA-directed DNA polymerase
MAKRKARQDSQKSVDPTSEAWRKLPWRKFEQHVYRIQKRIYRANQRGNSRAVHKLQKLLMKSEAARLLAVRRVTQDNQGKKTAGIDGIKSIPPKGRLAMADQIHPQHWKGQPPKPVRRVWIPKPGKAERRPLGIPTMLERSKQALVKLALEPEWEAVFEPNSYGFRPGRSCHDALEQIQNCIRRKPKYVLDADIKGCFDNINQTALLAKLHTFPLVRQTIRAWLKAGVMEGTVFTPTEAGAPQGGVISPLLANVALDGMEQAIIKGYPKGHRVEKPMLVRYADDFLIFHSEKAAIEQAATVIAVWLADMGLILNPKKTRITHTYLEQEGQVGFDFLGCTVRQFPVGKTHTVKSTHGQPLGYKTIIRPSKEAVQRHTTEMGKRIKRLRGAPQAALIKDLNPVIRGWSNYYRTVSSSRAFAACDTVLYAQLVSWAKWRHAKKGKRWRKDKYWRTIEGREGFAVSDTFKLRQHSQTHIIRPYVKVRGSASPYDGNMLYWSQRLKNHPLLSQTKAKLLQKQQGKCRWCELHFRDGDLMELDHLDRNRNNNALSNLMVLHLHCHDGRHAKLAETETIRQKLADAGINIQ